MNDESLIFEAYKKSQIVSELNLGAAGMGEGLGTPIHTNITHKPSDYNPPLQECKCKHGNDCHSCSECAGIPSEECEGCDGVVEDIEQFTDIAKQQLYRIHKISEMLHELIDHHSFKPWMASKIAQASTDLSSIYDRVDYDVAVKHHSEHEEPEVEAAIQLPEELQ